MTNYCFVGLLRLMGLVFWRSWSRWRCRWGRRRMKCYQTFIFIVFLWKWKLYFFNIPTLILFSFFLFLFWSFFLLFYYILTWRNKLPLSKCSLRMISWCYWLTFTINTNITKNSSLLLILLLIPLLLRRSMRKSINLPRYNLILLYLPWTIP